MKLSERSIIEIDLNLIKQNQTKYMGKILVKGYWENRSLRARAESQRDKECARERESGCSFVVFGATQWGECSMDRSEEAHSWVAVGFWEE